MILISAGLALSFYSSRFEDSFEDSSENSQERGDIVGYPVQIGARWPAEDVLSRALLFRQDGFDCLKILGKCFHGKEGHVDGDVWPTLVLPKCPSLIVRGKLL